MTFKSNELKYILLFFILFFSYFDIMAQNGSPKKEVIINHIQQFALQNQLNIKTGKVNIHKLHFTTTQYPECLVATRSKINGTKRTILSGWVFKNGRWQAGPWFTTNCTDYRILNIEQDSFVELQLILEEKQDSSETKTVKIISLKNGIEQVLFSYRNFKHLYSNTNLYKHANGTLLTEQHIIKLKDLNRNGCMDISERVIKTYYHPKECACDSGISNDMKQKVYNFVDGHFVLEKLLD